MVADQQYDADSADELFTLERTEDSSPADCQVEKQARKQTLKKTTGNARGSAEGSRKKVSWADIIKLMKNDPDRYQALSDEIMAAYAEGRVK